MKLVPTQVHVTEEDIALAKKHDSPLDRAIRRLVIPFTDVCWWNGLGLENDMEGLSYSEPREDAPAEVGRYARAYNRGDRVEPATFTINVPEPFLAAVDNGSDTPGGGM